MRIKFIILALVVFISGCVKPTEYTEEPVIEFISLNKNVIEEGIDSLIITFSFKDGDGDIGINPEDNTTQQIKNLKFYDSRDKSNLLTQEFTIPEIPGQGAGNGISGEISAKIHPRLISCLNIPEDESETFVYSFQIEDRLGNLSNFAETDTITILCE